MFAKSIQLFLMDGEANGRWACEMSNWSGKAYKIPRTMISSSNDRADLTSTGARVTMMFCKMWIPSFAGMTEKRK